MIQRDDSVELTLEAVGGDFEGDVASLSGAACAGTALRGDRIS
jgi:hypothetical protein